MLIDDTINKRLDYLGESMMVKSEEELEKELDNLSFEG